ncbi:MAG: hypothetical protein AAB387_01085, partial [candidate division NC10 bacterium]
MLSAAAKINLVLEVLGKRADGYHEIATVLQAVELSDRLVIEDAEVLEFRATAPDVPTDGTNLVLRAARALGEASGMTRGARITLDKRIPVAAGLGGGSTDAAATLVGLNRLWGLRWPAARLAEVARYVSELANLVPDAHLPYVGASAFAHKAGLHVSGIMKWEDSYQHVDPARVGNIKRVLVSELSGKSNIVYKMREKGLE